MRMVEASPKVKLFIEPSRTGNTLINNFFLIFRRKKMNAYTITLSNAYKLNNLNFGYFMERWDSICKSFFRVRFPPVTDRILRFLSFNPDCNLGTSKYSLQFSLILAIAYTSKNPFICKNEIY